MANFFLVPSGPANLKSLFPSVIWEMVKDYYVEAVEGSTVVATSPIFKIGCCCSDGSGQMYPSESCVNVSFGETVVLNNVESGAEYNQSIPLNGTPPFNLSSITKPSWMAIAISGSNVLITGTAGAEEADVPVSFTVTNCSTGSVTHSSTIDIIAACIDVTLADTGVPNGLTGTPYNVDYVISGTPPFALGAVDVPAWMTTTISEVMGSWILNLGGTPDAPGFPLTVSVEITNCSTGSFTLERLNFEVE